MPDDWMKVPSLGVLIPENPLVVLDRQVGLGHGNTSNE
jgi:hypothetical protein